MLPIKKIIVFLGVCLNLTLCHEYDEGVGHTTTNSMLDYTTNNIVKRQQYTKVSKLFFLSTYTTRK